MQTDGMLIAPADRVRLQIDLCEASCPWKDTADVQRHQATCGDVLGGLGHTKLGASTFGPVSDHGRSTARRDDWDIESVNAENAMFEVSGPANACKVAGQRDMTGCENVRELRRLGWAGTPACQHPRKNLRRWHRVCRGDQKYFWHAASRTSKVRPQHYDR
eukprot:2645349-Prymnesium_polylepis.1